MSGPAESMLDLALAADESVANISTASMAPHDIAARFETFCGSDAFRSQSLYQRRDDSEDLDSSVLDETFSLPASGTAYIPYAAAGRAPLRERAAEWDALASLVSTQEVSLVLETLLPACLPPPSSCPCCCSA